MPQIITDEREQDITYLRASEATSKSKERKFLLRTCCTLVICTVALTCGKHRVGGPPAFEELRKIDVHGHYFQDIPDMAVMLRRINVEVINVCTRGHDPDTRIWLHHFTVSQYKKYGDTFRFAGTFDISRRNEPAYAGEVTSWLDETYADGAVMTKIWKEVGLEAKTPGGKWKAPHCASVRDLGFMAAPRS